MSATFLIREEFPPLLLAVGEQRIQRDRTSLSYRGGFLPTRLKVDVAPLVAAVDSVPGLAGLVGVDFMRCLHFGDSSILEINPRATTSIVGILGLCRPGALAELWAIRPPEGLDDHEAGGESIRREIKEHGPIYFEPSGRTLKFAALADGAAEGAS
jgi:predicted ATP-grasp superfamily ATP-dependent carboligase